MSARKRLPTRRQQEGSTATIAGHTLHVGIGRYPDGRVGELWIDLSHREGGPLRCFAHVLAMLASLGLQHGVPVATIVAQLKTLAFEPSGDVEGDEEIKTAASLLDYVAQVLERADRGRVSGTGAEPDAFEVKDYGGASIFSVSWCDEPTARAEAADMRPIWECPEVEDDENQENAGAPYAPVDPSDKRPRRGGPAICERPCADCGGCEHHFERGWIEHADGQPGHEAAKAGCASWWECYHCPAWVECAFEDDLKERAAASAEEATDG